MEQGFQKADSNNLPKISIDMITEYVCKNANFVAPEYRNVKTQRASKESYGDNAVGYVQLKRESSICIVKAKVTPEHKVNKKPYNVEVIIEEKKESVLSCECKDCAASEGGCKHAIAILFWLHRRTEEASVTSVTCYWKKALLSDVPKHGMKLKQIFDYSETNPSNLESDYLSQTVSKLPQSSGILFDLYREPRFENINMHHLVLQFYNSGHNRSAKDFIEFCKSKVSNQLCEDAEKATRNQSECKDWYELRYGRITASKLYEAAHCKVQEGSLVQAIVGGSKKLRTEPILRGKLLESAVLKKVGLEKNISVYRPGFFIDKELPIFGASPDGCSEEFCIEVKCPSTSKTVTHYISNGKINSRYYFQLQLNMFLTKKKKGLFCIASPEFESNSEVSIVEVAFDVENLKCLLDTAQMFWETNVYPVILRTVM